MAPKALGWACAVVLLGSSVASAQIDFGRMLGSLAFADEEPPAVVAEDQVPVADPPVVRRVPLDELLQEEERDLPPLPAPPPRSPDDDPGMIGGSGVAQPEDEGVAPAPAGGSVDLDALAPEGDEPRDVPLVGGASPSDLTPPATAPPVMGQPVLAPPAFASPLVASQDCDNPHGYDYPQGQAYASTALPPRRAQVLRPTPCLDMPNLPPPTTAENLYRTPACYRDLWSGYAGQQAHECQTHHRHLHGHCKCLNKAQRECGAQCECGSVAR